MSDDHADDGDSGEWVRSRTGHETPVRRTA